MYPSSPNCPCSALKIISGLNNEISFDKFLSGSLIKTLYPFLINSLATCFPVSRLISRSLDIPPDNIKIFFSSYFKILISFSNTIPVFFFDTCFNKFNQFIHIFKASIIFIYKKITVLI